MHEIKQYYLQQAGTGIAGFHGLRYQRGSGFFGRLLSKAIYPLIRFLGGKAVTTGANIANDVLLNNKPLKESALSRLEETGKDILKSGVERGKKFLMEGKGKAIKVKRKLISLNKIINGRIKKKVKLAKKYGNSLQKIKR